MKQSQKLLLTWMIEDEQLFEIIRQYISPEDFTEDIFRKTADILYQQKEQGAVNPAGIISLFADEEEQREIAELFHARLQKIESRSDREKALKETILRVKQNSISYKSMHLAPTDMQGMQQLILDKRQLENLEKLHISIE